MTLVILLISLFSPFVSRYLNSYTLLIHRSFESPSSFPVTLS